jgi:hypothetical protein
MGCAGLTVLALAGVTGPTWPWPKLPAKRASVSTWAWSAGETVAVAAVMLAGYRAAGAAPGARGDPGRAAARPHRRVVASSPLPGSPEVAVAVAVAGWGRATPSSPETGSQ